MSEFKVGLYGEHEEPWTIRYQIVKRTPKFLYYIPMYYLNKYKKLMPSHYKNFGDDYDYIIKKKIKKDDDNNEYIMDPRFPTMYKRINCKSLKNISPH
tara:strand:- start:21246 stop:21539 length:294 start_codon:yes stop_codon:yes gene_type:complete